MAIEKPTIHDEPEAPYQETIVDHVLPGYDGCPIGELNQTYRNLGFTSAQVSMIKEKYFTVIDNGEPDHLKLVTAIHTDPSTGEHFGSGHYVFKQANGSVREAVKVGDVYWYSKYTT